MEIIIELDDKKIAGVNSKNRIVDEIRDALVRCSTPGLIKNVSEFKDEDR